MVFVYNIGDIEMLDFGNAQWRSAAEGSNENNKTDDSNHLSNSGPAALRDTSSNELLERKKTHVNFIVSPFLLHEAKGFCQKTLLNAYAEEESSF